MAHVECFVKQSAGGQLLTIVKEHYVRDDIESGSPLDPQCSAAKHKLSADADHYLLVDTNIVLHQPDFLEHPSIQDVVILSTVYQEVHHKNSSVFLRLKDMLRSTQKRFFYFSNEFHKDTHVQTEKGESANDRNDRAIRVAALWYTKHVAGKQVILLTDDAANKQKAVQMGITAMSMEEYTSSKVKDEAVVDLVAWGASEQSGASRKRQRLYKEHLSYSEVNAGIKDRRFFQSSIRMNRYNPTEAWVTNSGENQEVLVKGRTNLNRAFDGDTVIVQLLPTSQWERPSRDLPSRKKAGKGDQDAAPSSAEAHIAPEVEAEQPVASGAPPCGEVVAIVKRSWRSRGYAGSLKEDTQATPGRMCNALFVAMERSVPYIRIQTRQAAQLMDKRLVVVIDEWPVDSRYPLGHYVRTLGVIGEVSTESDALLLEYDVNTAPFTSAVQKCVPPLPAEGHWKPTEAECTVSWRKDLRSLCVCSVDPPGCKDIDDALHARKLPNGNTELGVHIADVTNFCQPGSAMDEEAARRSTTVYLVNRRIDMFPKPLTEDICSLRAGLDRLAFSVIWEVTPDVEVVNIEYTKSVIHSRAAMTYEMAQNLIIDSSKSDEVTQSLRELMRIAKVLRKRRYEAGALSLASPEVKFKLDDTNSPLDVGMYELRETNMMVEEMMLMANITVATHIHKSFPSCAVLRRHETPTPSMFKPLHQALQAWGMGLQTETSKQFAESLDSAVLENDPYFNQIVRIMATRCMTQAKYLSSGTVSYSAFLHYGLAAPIYTHFTSPIRRYADVLVHRCLAASLGLMPLPEALKEREHMDRVVDNMNDRHTNAARAGRSSTQLHTLVFFKDREQIADARVLKVQANGVIVLVPKFGIEGPVFFGGSEGEDSTTGVAFDEDQQEVKLPDGQVFKVFSKCAVKIFVHKGPNHRNQLRMELVDRATLQDTDMVKGS